MLKKLMCLLMGLMLSVTHAQNTLPMLSKLTDMPGASGFEQQVRQFVKEQWKNDISDLKTDGMGNLIGRHKNNQEGPKLLLMAHMDETGFLVESITDDGFVQVVPLGGIASAVMYAQKWDISTPNGLVTGYSGMDSPHILSDSSKMSGTPEPTSLFLDIGAQSKKEAEEYFHIRQGLSVTPHSQFTPLGQHRYLAKALDDRLGLAAISDTLNRIKNHQQPNQLLVAATVQEEIGLRGAQTVYASTGADVVVNIEVGIADDYPALLAKRKGRIKLGQGPTIFVYDRSMIPNQALLDWVLKLAKDNHINVQLEVEPGYGEDGSKVQGSGAGVPAINIGIPIRYAHQHLGVFDDRDYRQAVKLLNVIVRNFNHDVLKNIQEQG